MAKPFWESTALLQSTGNGSSLAMPPGDGFHGRRASLKAGRWLPIPVFALVLWVGASETSAQAGEGSLEQTTPDVGQASEAARPADMVDPQVSPPSNPATPAALPEGEESTNLVKLLLGGEGRDISELDLEGLLQTTVATSIKSESGENEAPTITTVIERDEILRWGYRSVVEALTHVTGTYVIDDQIIPNLGVRGVSGGLRSESGLVKVMIDGHSVAFHSTGGNWLGPELIPLSAVQRIEVVRGPASTLYGADAFLGAINIVTRRPSEMKGGELGVNTNYAGSTLATGQDASLGTVLGKFELLAGYRIHAEDHSGLQLPRSSPSPTLTTASSPDWTARDLAQGSSVVFAKVSHQTTPHARLSLVGYFSQLDRGAEFANWAELTHGLDANGRASGTNISLRQATLDLKAEFTLSPRLDVTIDGLFFKGGPTGRDRIEAGSDAYYIKRDFGYQGMDLGVEAKWRPSSTLSIQAGAGYILDSEKLLLAKEVLKEATAQIPAGGTSTLLSGIREHVTFHNPAAHMQLEWSPNKSWLRVVAGARFDHHNLFGDHLSTRLGVVASLAEGLHLRLFYGSAFKAPSPELLYGFPLAAGDIMGNAQLKPSFLHSAEAQLSYRYGKYVLLSTGLAGSYLLHQAEFTQQGDNQVAYNMGRTLSLSFENEVHVDYNKLFAAYLNTALNHTVRSSEELTLGAGMMDFANLAYPKFIANTGISAKLAQLPLRLGIEASVVSTRRATRSNIIDHGGLYSYTPYFVAGGSLQTVGLCLLPERASVIRFVARNVLGTRIIDPGFAGVDYPQTGRTLMLDLIQAW